MLAALLGIIGIMLLALAITIRIISKADKDIDISLLKATKFSYMFNVMNQWMQALHAGKNMERYLIDSGYEKIAIYGICNIGERLFEHLAETNITIAYAIDKNRELSNCDINVYKPTDVLPPVDLVVVTTALYFYEIKRQLQEKVKCPIISIEELVERMK